jgi:dTMP kinase
METVVSTLTTSAVRILAGRPYENGGGESDIAALLAFWKENKFPLLSLNHASGSSWLWNLPEFKADWERHKTLFNSLSAEYVSIRNRWAQAGISCLLIKSGRSAPSFPYTSDNLDVLVREGQEAAARAILREQGYVELRHIEEPKKFLFRKFIGGECVSAIHLHTQVGWEVGFMDEDSLWARARLSADDASVTTPSSEDIILITIAHSFYENKRFRLADIVKIRECWQGSIVDWECMERIARQRGWLDGLRFCILLFAHVEKAIWNDNSVPAAVIDTCLNSLGRYPLVSRYYRRITRRSPVSLPFTLSFFFSKFLYYKKVISDRNTSLGTKVYDVIRTLLNGFKLKLHVHSQPSLLVTFSGPDGSGKTQHARTLLKSMGCCGLRTGYYWSRIETSSLIRFGSGFVKTLTGNKREQKEKRPGGAGRQDWLRNPLRRFLWSYTVAIDMILSYLLHVRLPLLMGKIVVCDRYVFDAAAEIAGSLPPDDSINRWATKLMLSLAPKPDVAYLLDIPEDICAQRKDEDTDPDYLRRQRVVYMELARRYHLRIKNTDGEFSAIADEIVGEVLNPYFENYRTFLSGLFISNPGQLNPRRTGAK